MNYEVSIVLVKLEKDLSAWCKYISTFVSENEKARASKFLNIIDAARHLTGRAVIRKAISDFLGKKQFKSEFSTNKWGKPYAHNIPVDFNISHAGEFVGVAVCFNQDGVGFGIDIEKLVINSEIYGLAKILHLDECTKICELPEKEACRMFYRIWARKEAISKALGMGLNLPLDSFKVTSNESQWSVFHLGPPENWTTIDIPIPGYYCSFAATRADITINYVSGLSWVNTGSATGKIKK